MKRIKLRMTTPFKRNPDAAIREYELPAGKKSTRQILDKELSLCLVTTANSQSDARKEFYVMGDGTLKHRIGNYREMSYEEARQAAIRYLNSAENINTKTVKTPKIPTLRGVWNIVIKENQDGWRPNTISKYQKTFNARFRKYADWPITKINTQIITEIADDLRDNGQRRASLNDLFKILPLIELVAKINKYITEPLYEPGLKRRYRNFKSKNPDGYGVVNEEDNLLILIKYINSYKEGSTKNALKLALCTGLRPGNARLLKRENICYDKKKSVYYLHFTPNDMKVAENGHQHIGIPRVLAEWALSLLPPEAAKDALLFPSPIKDEEGKEQPLSNMAMVKALKAKVLTDNGITIVAHSFRKIVSSFANDSTHETDFDTYAVERVLAHQVKGVAGLYNKAKNIQNTLQVTEWWVKYLLDLGLEL